MRASLITETLVLAPGQPGVAVVEVTNTLGVIDGVTASARTDEGLTSSCLPALLALFPGSSGQIDLTFTVGRHFPAGRHRIPVEVCSSVDSSERLELILAVEVLPVPAAAITIDPPRRRARHRARYRITATNQGNTTLELDLAAADPDRAVTARVEPATLTVGPGVEAYGVLRVQARRHLLGTDRRHAVTVLGRAGELEVDTTASLDQPPLIPVGVRTAAVLAVIVAMWAAVFIVAISKANSSDPLTKQVPPSFYAAIAATHPVNTSSFGVLGRPGLLAAATDGPLPAGAVPKSGVVIGVGGTINGTIDAASTGSGIGRITVEAVRDSPNGPVLVSSAATDSNGNYSLVGLLPGSYKLLLSATGYQQQWYPDASTEAAANPVQVAAESTTSGVDATISGLPGSITGTVYTGQTPSPPVVVTVVSQQGNGRPVATVTSDASGKYTIASLPTPGTYDLSFSSPGYQVASDTEVVAGGEAHIANTVTMSAGTGSLAGVVTDGTNPLGGVTITANANGRTVTSATPTIGGVGQFDITNLTTPATYLLTFSRPGYGTTTVAEHLGPGQSLSSLSIALTGGAGQISGQVKSAAGAALGGVTVTVDSAAGGVTTQSLTAGSIGSFLLSGLTTPGNYTLTFSLAGYQSQTVSVPLGSSGSASGVNVQLAPVTGTISGTVTSSTGGTLSGVAVTITDGKTVRNTTTTSSPAGGFSLTGLPPSSYSVTFSLSGYQSSTVLVHLQPGQSATASATLVSNTTPGA